MRFMRHVFVKESEYFTGVAADGAALYIGRGTGSVTHRRGEQTSEHRKEEPHYAAQAVKRKRRKGGHERTGKNACDVVLQIAADTAVASGIGLRKRCPFKQIAVRDIHPPERT